MHSILSAGQKNRHFSDRQKKNGSKKERRMQRQKLARVRQAYERVVPEKFRAQLPLDVMIEKEEYYGPPRFRPIEIYQGDPSVRRPPLLDPPPMDHRGYGGPPRRLWIEDMKLMKTIDQDDRFDEILAIFQGMIGNHDSIIWASKSIDPVAMKYSSQPGTIKLDEIIDHHILLSKKGIIFALLTETFQRVKSMPRTFMTIYLPECPIPHPIGALELRLAEQIWRHLSVFVYPWYMIVTGGAAAFSPSAAYSPSGMTMHNNPFPLQSETVFKMRNLCSLLMRMICSLQAAQIERRADRGQTLRQQEASAVRLVKEQLGGLLSEHQRLRQRQTTMIDRLTRILQGGDVQKKRRKQMELPSYFQDPIQYTRLEDPVVASDGHTYSRKTAQELIRSGRTGINGVILQPGVLIPNRALIDALDEYDKQWEAIPDDARQRYIQRQKAPQRQTPASSSSSMAMAGGGAAPQARRRPSSTPAMSGGGGSGRGGS